MFNKIFAYFICETDIDLTQTCQNVEYSKLFVKQSHNS